jgi:hypothetical protein
LTSQGVGTTIPPVESLTRKGPQMDDEIVLKAGRLYGPWRQPRNLHNDIPGSIHNDATARKLGFRGGTIAGNIHFEMLVPLLLRAFGPRWFERGTLSVDFKFATVDREDVRGVLTMPPEGATDVQVEVLMERPTGEVVGIGTASVGNPGARTALAAKDLSKYAAGEYTILKDVHPGDKFPVETVTIPKQALEERMQVITELLPWYVGDSPWGGPILTPTVLVHALTTAHGPFLSERKVKAVGLYGAIELRNINGPVFAGQTYRTSGEVIARGQSPKTEYIWYEAYLEHPGGKRIAEMLMQLRFMKGSAELLPSMTGGEGAGSRRTAAAGEA